MAEKRTRTLRVEKRGGGWLGAGSKTKKVETIRVRKVSPLTGRTKVRTTRREVEE